RVFSVSAGLSIKTVTPGSTAPDVSFTTPVIDPPAPCAYEADGTTSAAITSASAQQNCTACLFITVSLIGLTSANTAAKPARFRLYVSLLSESTRRRCSSAQKDRG